MIQMAPNSLSNPSGGNFSFKRLSNHSLKKKNIPAVKIKIPMPKSSMAFIRETCFRFLLSYSSIIRIYFQGGTNYEFYCSIGINVTGKTKLTATLIPFCFAGFQRGILLHTLITSLSNTSPPLFTISSPETTPSLFI